MAEVSCKKKVVKKVDDLKASNKKDAVSSKEKKSKSPLGKKSVQGGGGVRKKMMENEAEGPLSLALKSVEKEDKKIVQSRSKRVAKEEGVLNTKEESSSDEMKKTREMWKKISENKGVKVKKKPEQNEKLLKKTKVLDLALKNDALKKKSDVLENDENKAGKVVDSSESKEAVLDVGADSVSFKSGERIGSKENNVDNNLSSNVNFKAELTDDKSKNLNVDDLNKPGEVKPSGSAFPSFQGGQKPGEVKPSGSAFPSFQGGQRPGEVKPSGSAFPSFQGGQKPGEVKPSGERLSDSSLSEKAADKDQIVIKPTTPFSGHNPNFKANVEHNVVDNTKSEKESFNNLPKNPDTVNEKNTSSEAVKAEVVESLVEKKEDVSESFEDFDSGETFFDVLAEAGISKALFFWLLTGFVLIVFSILFFIFGGFNWLLGDDFKEEEPTNTVVSEESFMGNESSVSSVIEVGEVSSDNASFDASLVGVNASFLLGDEYNSRRIDLVYYLDLLRQMQDIYRVDIYKYLDRNSERRESLNTFLDDMRTLLEDADTSVVAINRTLNNLDASYSVLLDKKDAYEDMFFNSVDTFHGSEAYDNLEFFIEFSQDSIAVKAYFSAYSNILDMFEQMLSLLGPRYEDIVVNKDALIKGIRVFDIPDSDIEAIIPLGND
jgi:hypothetical protein